MTVITKTVGDYDQPTLKIEFTTDQGAEAFAKRFFYLAWKASGVFGYGALQDNLHAVEAEVWYNVQTAGDYPGGSHQPTYRFHADYVFGRMMKVGLKMKDGCVYIPLTEPDAEYQSWSTTYKTELELSEAVITSLLSDASADQEASNESIT